MSVRVCLFPQIILGFSNSFWPADMYDCVCTDSFVPEFWMLRYPATNRAAGLANHTIVGFVAGSHMEAIQHLSQEEVSCVLCVCVCVT